VGRAAVGRGAALAGVAPAWTAPLTEVWRGSTSPPVARSRVQCDGYAASSVAEDNQRTVPLTCEPPDAALVFNENAAWNLQRESVHAPDREGAMFDSRGTLRSTGAVWVQLLEDITLTSNADGTLRYHVLTPPELQTMGLNLESFLGCMRISSIDQNCSVVLRYQYSFDGYAWLDATAPVIGSQTTAGSTTGEHSDSTEITPFLRIRAAVVATSGSVQVTARMSVWGYFRYRV
jgi:hypothetical protein